MRAVLLAGGKGTRLYPYTAVFPKPLVPIDNVPIMEILIRQLKHYGFDHITLCVGHLSYLLKSYFGNGENFGVKIDYSLEQKPLGTVAPLTLINDLPKTFLVANGDLLTDADFGSMIKTHKNSKAALTVGVYNRHEKIELGVLDISNSQITGYREKPEMDFSVSAGCYVFEKKVLELVPKNEYFDFPSLVNILLENKTKIAPFVIDGYWLDIGRPDDYQKAIEKFSMNKGLFLKEFHVK
ncbi:NTP transferase domain-containing protein [Candidatus Woesebacteria bacterium]|nr:NTP transferase domain-containing protein [Candidatus Woesebacteria bacterium]